MLSQIEQNKSKFNLKFAPYILLEPIERSGYASNNIMIKMSNKNVNVKDVFTFIS